MKGLRAGLDLRWFSLILRPTLGPADCCLFYFSFSSGIGTYGESITHQGSHDVTNSNSPCAGGADKQYKKINHDKEKNHDKETYKIQSGIRLKTTKLPSGKDFQIPVICKNAASSQV